MRGRVEKLGDKAEAYVLPKCVFVSSDILSSEREKQRFCCTQSRVCNLDKIAMQYIGIAVTSR